ncbi:tetratricopeptide repeat protein [Arenibaculum pallidiluteum]|uniref:tetratricopeptide repeat protein n=1 Tax=Arenibaculum pallidiluteum TaxID=2812559 RepID=UPI001A960360|nr:tetratricopeptide repeat protein [Arenibaculum pallidiluteum]
MTAPAMALAAQVGAVPPDQLLQAAAAAHRDGRLDEAELLYRRVLDEAPDDPDALHLLGVLLGRRGSDGLALIERALARRPDWPDALYNLANGRMREGGIEAAMALLRRVLELEPDHRPARNLLPIVIDRAIYACGGAPVPPEGDVVLFLNKRGLGDNLLFSTLPGLFAATGRRFFVSDQNPVRNPEIHELVWGCNPHVAGISKAFPNAGVAPMLKGFDRLTEITNWLTRMEVLHGFAPSNDLPRLHYAPSRHAQLAGAVLVDLHSKTIHYRPESLRAYLDMICARFHYARADLVQIAFAGPDVGDPNLRLEGVPTYTVKSIFDYCDAIASARALITVHSGANSMAAALRRDAPSPMLHCAVDAEHFNQKCYIWRNIDYTIV